MNTRRMQEEFSNNFFKEHLQQATLVAFQQIGNRDFDLKSEFQFSKCS